MSYRRCWTILTSSPVAPLTSSLGSGRWTTVVVEAGTVVSTGVTDADTGWAASVGDVAADPPPDVPRASAPHPATPAKATTATTAGAHRRMLVGSTGGTSAAPLRFVCDGPRVQGEPAVGGALMVPTGLRADLAGSGPFPGTSRPGPFQPQRSGRLVARRVR